MNKILATAYAINPYKGSEDGMGWNFTCQIARFNKITVVTRENNKPHIERFISEYPNSIYDNISFLYFDLPYWARFWKKGSRGAMLYYYLWQFFMPYFLKKQKIEYNIVHNLNFHNDWTPSRLYLLNKPFVWGPVGHHPLIPKQYLKPIYGIFPYLKDRATWFLKLMFWKTDPFLKLTSKKADIILAMNSSVNNYLKKSNKTIIMPSVSSEEINYTEKVRTNSFKIISVGRFVPLKGFDLTIKAFSYFIKRIEKKEGIELICVGDGPYYNYMCDLINKEGITDFVKIIKWIERSKLQEIYKESDLFLFPSHEGAGMVVSEAMSYGLPTICLDNYGPGEFITNDSGIGIAHQEYNKTIIELGDAIMKLYTDYNYYYKLSKGSRKRFEDYFNWDRKGEKLNEIYMSLNNE